MNRDANNSDRKSTGGSKKDYSNNQQKSKNYYQK